MALIASALATFSSAAARASTPPAADYELLFEDAFDGTTLNEKHWQHRVGPRQGTGIDGLNLARAVRVADGHLIVAAWQERIKGKTENIGGGVISRHRFGYGYYETRSRPFMAGRGVHTAFWQRGLGEQHNTLFEIDSHEIDSTQKLACNNLYVVLAPKGWAELPWPHRAHVPLQLPPDGWWIDAYEYTPDGVIFYDHGREVARADFPDLVAAQNVWLTALNGVGRVDGEKQPGESRFDYFRFYARDYPGANLLPNGGFDYNLDKYDPQHPLAWTEEGDVAASRVVPLDAANGAYALRHQAERPYAVTTRQTLEFIRDGDYELTARVRRTGRHTAAVLRVSGHGGVDQELALPLSADWQEVRLAPVTVRTHSVTIAIASAGTAGDRLEVDDVQFLKPAGAGQSRRPSRPIGLLRPGEPIWQIAQRAPLEFTGDEKFYFFSRNSGLGEAITVTLLLEPRASLDTFPLARLPKTGSAGWGVGLTARGDVFFRVGSQAAHRDIVVAAEWRAGQRHRLTCQYDHGRVRIWLDGVLRREASVEAFAPTDATAPGRLGANSGLYDAVGEVTLLAAAGEAPKAQRFRNFVGRIGDVRIYNRALSAAEVAALGAP